MTTQTYSPINPNQLTQDTLAYFYRTSNRVSRAWYVNLSGQIVYGTWKEAQAYLKENYGFLHTMVWKGESQRVWKSEATKGMVN